MVHFKRQGNVILYLFADKQLTQNHTKLRYNVKCKQLNIEWNGNFNKDLNEQSHKLMNKIKTSNYSTSFHYL